ncbi:MAG TPA: hypothetical protein VGX23_13705 [Actinocrinis sp.]|nr:hypothetical protein [Actinocrinis sp.]
MSADTLLFAPDVPERDRLRLINEPEAQIPYTAGTAEQLRRRTLVRPNRKPFWRPVLLCVGAYLVGQFWPGESLISYCMYGVSAASAALFAAYEVRWALDRSSIRKLAAGLHHQYLKPSIDLDKAGRILVHRAQVAATTITQCRLQADGLLDEAANNAVLPALLWELATQSADLAVRRAELARSLLGAGPATLAALEPVQSALAAADQALAQRVAALERVAADAAQLDVRYQDMMAARAVAAGHDAVVDLVAGRERDAVALTEIAMIADGLPGPRALVDEEMAALSESARRLRISITDIRT